MVEYVLDRRGADHDLGAVGTQEGDLLLAHLVGHDEDAAVALDRCRDREADPGVPRRGLDDRAARLELSVVLGGFDQRQADAVLERAAGLQIFELGEEHGPAGPAELLEADDRRAADELQHGRVVARHRCGL